MPRIDYNRGTISLTNNSDVVTGNKTYWIGNVNPNDLLYINSPEVTGWYQVKEVQSDTRIILTELYQGTDLTEAFYYARRNPDRYLTAELARTQLLILDQQTELESKFDGIDEDVAEAQSAAAKAVEYSANAEQSANTANEHMLQAIAASQESLKQAENAQNARNEAENFATVATQQATIATNKANEAANSAIEAENTKTEFENTKGQPNGVTPLDSSGKVPAEYIPGSFREVYAAATLNDFPSTGDETKLYLAKDTSKTYMWSASANEYVNTDTTLALAGTGTAPSAAHSDHHHDGVYEPFRNLEWAGSINEATTDINTQYFKEGSYIITNPKTINIKCGNIGNKTGTISQLSRRRISTTSLLDVAIANISSSGNTLIYRTVTGSGTTISAVSTWEAFSSANALTWQGMFPVFADSYNSGSADTNALYFITEESSGTVPTFAIKTINGRYADGTGNIDIELSQGKLVEISTSGANYANANNILENGRYHLSITTTGLTTNYPTVDLNHLAEVTATVNAGGQIFSVFQRFTSINTSTGGLAENFRYGLNNGSGGINFSAWIKIK